MGDYYFNSEGGCDLCDAMEGWYDAEPPRPHPNCNCEINSEAPLGYSFDYVVGDTSSGDDGPGGDFSVSVQVTVECFNGRTIAETIEVDFEKSELPTQDVANELESQIEEAAEDLADEMMASCGEGGGRRSETSHRATIYVLEDYDPDSDESVTIQISVTVECDNGRTIEDETTLEFEPDEYGAEAYFDYLDDKIYEEASQAAAELADDCPEPSYEGRDVDDDFGNA